MNFLFPSFFLVQFYTVQHVLLMVKKTYHMNHHFPLIYSFTRKWSVGIHWIFFFFTSLFLTVQQSLVSPLSLGSQILERLPSPITHTTTSTPITTTTTTTATTTSLSPFWKRLSILFLVSILISNKVPRLFIKDPKLT